jgi:hypothetical protein
MRGSERIMNYLFFCYFCLFLCIHNSLMIEIDIQTAQNCVDRPLVTACFIANWVFHFDEINDY